MACFVLNFTVGGEGFLLLFDLVVRRLPFLRVLFDREDRLVDILANSITSIKNTPIASSIKKNLIRGGLNGYPGNI